MDLQDSVASPIIGLGLHFERSISDTSESSLRHQMRNIASMPDNACPHGPAGLAFRCACDCSSVDLYTHGPKHRGIPRIPSVDNMQVYT
jgi:hypothetical protein